MKSYELFEKNFEINFFKKIILSKYFLQKSNQAKS